MANPTNLDCITVSSTRTTALPLRYYCHSIPSEDKYDITPTGGKVLYVVPYATAVAIYLLKQGKETFTAK